MSPRVRLIGGDCLRVMRLMRARGILVDSIVCDPPYHLTSIVKRFGADGAKPTRANDAYKRVAGGFMGQKWDGGDIAFDPETWKLALAVLKPGGHLVAFGGTRGWHRMACAIEDAGFEIRDTVAWLYGSGFPKSHDVSKAIDKAAGAEREKVRHDNPRNPKTTGSGRDGTKGATRPWIEAAMERGYHELDSDIPATPEAAQWQGWGTALKPAFEPIVLARAPLGEKSVAANVLAHGTGAINVDGCRIYADGEGPSARVGEESQERRYDGAGAVDIAAKPGRRYKVKRLKPGATLNATGGNWRPDAGPDYHGELKEGRWPANVCHDGGAEVEAAFAAFGELKSGRLESHHKRAGKSQIGTFDMRDRTGEACNFGGDSGSAARFFYSAKAGPEDRFGSKHPTVKPVALMRWLARLVTPPGGLLLDPFAGSGSTGVAALAEGVRAILIEAKPEYQDDIRERLAWATGQGRHALVSKARHAAPEKTGHADLPLFASPEAPPPRAKASGGEK